MTTIAIKSLAGMWGHKINGKALGEVELPKGTGDYNTGLCVMQMVNVAIWGASHWDLKPTDSPSTPGSESQIDDDVTSFAISLNDTLAVGPRQRLREYVLQIANARDGDGVDRHTVRLEAEKRGFIFDQAFMARNVRKAFQTLDAVIAGRIDMLPDSYDLGGSDA